MARAASEHLNGASRSTITNYATQLKRKQVALEGGHRVVRALIKRSNSDRARSTAAACRSTARHFCGSWKRIAFKRVANGRGQGARESSIAAQVALCNFRRCSRQHWKIQPQNETHPRRECELNINGYFPAFFREMRTSAACPVAVELIAAVRKVNPQASLRSAIAEAASANPNDKRSASVLLRR